MAVALRPEPTTAIAVVDEPRSLGALTEDEFSRALERMELGKRRMARIFESVLVETAHYDKFPGFKHPILKKAGAEELQVGFRLQIATLRDEPDTVIAEPDFVSVTVRRCILDPSGRVLARTTASCTTKEKRFKKQDGSGWTYQDARECLNDCYAMAEKRASVRLTVAALGLAPWLQTEEEIAASLEEPAVETPITPWTDVEKKETYQLAVKAGLTKQAFKQLILDTLGRDKVGTGPDVERLRAAIAAWKAPAKQEPAAPAVEPEPATSAPAGPAPDLEYHTTETAAAPSAPSAASAPGAAEVFGKGNAGSVLPGEVEATQVAAGELPLGDAPPRRSRNALREG